MSLKVKLISTISAFILVLSMLFVGVFAAQNVELNVGGNVSFTASSVYAQITGSYVGTTEHPDTAQSLTSINIDAETTDGAVSMPDDWTTMPLNFDSSASPITVTISIQNLATDRAIAVSLTDNTNITGVSVARTYNTAPFEGNTSTQTINGGETGTFTFILTVTNQNNDISGTFDLDISLTNSSSTTSQTYTLTFDRSGSSTIAGALNYVLNGDRENPVEVQSGISSLNVTKGTTIEFYFENAGGSGGTIPVCDISFSPELYSAERISGVFSYSTSFVITDNVIITLILSYITNND